MQQGFFELHRRDIEDWRLNGPNERFPAGGVQEDEIIENERLLREYDSTNGIINVMGRKFIEEWPGPPQIVESVAIGSAAEGSCVTATCPQCYIASTTLATRVRWNCPGC